MEQLYWLCNYTKLNSLKDNCFLTLKLFWYLNCVLKLNWIVGNFYQYELIQRYMTQNWSTCRKAKQQSNSSGTAVTLVLKIHIVCIIFKQSRENYKLLIHINLKKKVLQKPDFWLYHFFRRHQLLSNKKNHPSQNLLTSTLCI